MTPTIGCIVRYRAHGSPNGQHEPEQRAAIIAKVHDERTVDLMVVNPTGLFFNQSCKYDESGLTPGSWFWPPHL